MQETTRVKGSVFARAVRAIISRGTPTTKTPLGEAGSIMGRQIHKLADLKTVFHLDDAFYQDNQHLQSVPYTVEELEWAAANRVLLTLTCPVSMRRFLQSFQGKIAMAAEVERSFDGIMRKIPSRLEWRLVMRSIDLKDEEAALKTLPKTLTKDRIEPPSFRLFASAMFADMRINGMPLIHMIGARSVKDVIVGPKGVTLRRVVVDGGNHPRLPAIRIITAQAHAPIRNAWSFLPHTAV